MSNASSLLALLEDVDVPTDDPAQPHAQDADTENAADGDEDEDADDDDDDNEEDDDMDLDAELDAELNAEGGEAAGNEEEEEGGDEETVNEEAAPDSVPQTPHSEQDDDKIGEDDIEDDGAAEDEDEDDHSSLEKLRMYPESGHTATLDTDLKEVLQPKERKDATEKDEDEVLQKAQMQERARRESRIVEHLDGIQMERYEKFRRSTIKPKNMKKLAETIVGKAVHPNVIAALCGVTKMRIGEVVETARILADRSGHYGALMPIHVHEAYQLMQMENRLPARKRHKRLFR